MTLEMSSFHGVLPYGSKHIDPGNSPYLLSFYNKSVDSGRHLRQYHKAS